jgi:hypothetical protein
MFFGTPHQGTGAGANRVRSTGDFVTWASEGSVLRELDLWSPWTVDTNNVFVGIVNGFTITALSLSFGWTPITSLCANSQIETTCIQQSFDG